MNRSTVVALPGLLLLVLLVLPVLGLTAGTSWAEITHALSLPSTHAALWLTLWTTGTSLVVIVVLGTPLAWQLSRGRGGMSRVANL
ncbi:MAG: hypothetical protein QGG40_10260, partial [Myxococcota bacterium]|nr:hypothetical protein [Myxococcota bacterium]